MEAAVVMAFCAGAMAGLFLGLALTRGWNGEIYADIRAAERRDALTTCHRISYLGTWLDMSVSRIRARASNTKNTPLKEAFDGELVASAAVQLLAEEEGGL